MSKWIDENTDGTIETTIADPEGCAWMYNEICCNDQSEYVADWPPEEYCPTCPLFKPETEVQE